MSLTENLIVKSMSEILKTPSPKRNLEWEESFLKSFAASEVFLRSDAPFMGPDGFSYMDVTTDKGEQKLKLEDFLAWCAHSGVGLVLNLQKNKTPDYVFNYGMLWNYLLRGSFVNKRNTKESDNKNLDPSKIGSSTTLLVHKILEGYLPQYVRENLKEFLLSNKINNTKIGLVSKGDQTDYELLFYFSASLKLSEKDSKTLLESLSWFLPLDYNVAVALKDDKSLHLEDL